MALCRSTVAGAAATARVEVVCAFAVIPKRATAAVVVQTARLRIGSAPVLDWRVLFPPRFEVGSMSPIALRSLLLVSGLPVSTQDAVTSAPKAARDAVRMAFAAWVWLSISVVLALIAWVNGLQPHLAAALFAIAASPALPIFLLLPALNADWAAAAVLGVWLVSVTVLVAVTGGAGSLLTAAFVVVLAQTVFLRRAWLGEAGAAVVLAYASAAAVTLNRGTLTGDLG